MKIFSFPKKEHLCGDKNIELLLKQGYAFIIYPFRVIYLFEKQENTINEVQVKVLISVAKKKHRRANSRNRLKRLMRESYRLNKINLLNFAKENALNISIAFQYISDEILKYNFIESKMREISIKLINNIEQKQHNETS
ncbi:MAG: ribonuclease P protein component [Paludibacter sp.]|nr:ribonuclease P protein component [Paludibacter sp.]